MDKKRVINVSGTSITITSRDEKDYICLTDMAKAFEGGSKLIEKWINTKNTLEFLGVWEELNNPNFNSPEFGGIITAAGSNKFYLSVNSFISKTNAIGIIAKAGRYGGTYASIDIAYHFGMWLSPEFNLLVIKEFRRLKSQEEQSLKSTEWLYRRFTAKANYIIQTDTIKRCIIPLSTLPKDRQGIIYANEAELINLATLNYTSKEWTKNNPELAKNGNLRDYLSLIDIIVLDNMQILNSHLIDQGFSKAERFEKLQEEAQKQFLALNKSRSIKKIEK